MGGCLDESQNKDSRKKMRNRLSAQRARDRQKARLQMLENQVQYLKNLNQHLKKENHSIKQSIAECVTLVGKQAFMEDILKASQYTHVDENIVTGRVHTDRTVEEAYAKMNLGEYVTDGMSNQNIFVAQQPFGLSCYGDKLPGYLHPIHGTAIVPALHPYMHLASYYQNLALFCASANPVTPQGKDKSMTYCKDVPEGGNDSGEDGRYSVKGEGESTSSTDDESSCTGSSDEGCDKPNEEY